MKILRATILFSVIFAAGSGFHASAQTLGSWERIEHRSTFTLWDVTFTDSLHGCAVGDYGVILLTTDGGISWSQRLSKRQFAFRKIHFFDDSTGIATGFHGTCFRTTDAGEHWESISIGTEATLPGMAAVGSTVWLSGEGGTMLKSTDRGSTWKSLRTGTDRMLDAISFADERHGWASSVQRILLRTVDGGESWEEIPVDVFTAMTALHARSAEEVWMAGYHGLIMRSLDGGITWSEIDAYRTDYVDITFDDRGRGWAAGNRGAVVHAREGNLSWRLHDLTDAGSLHAIAFLPNNTAVAVGDAGAIYRLAEVYPAAQSTMEAPANE